MANLSVVQPEVLIENKMTINSFLKDSYNHAKKQVQDGMDYLNESVSSLKDGFSFMHDRTSYCLNRMALPINNFLKDLSEIDMELQKELSIQSGELISLDGKLVPVEYALSLPMEENH